MTDPADSPRRDAKRQRPEGKTLRVLRASATLRAILIAAALLALGSPLGACLPRTPALPTLSRPLTTTSSAPDAGILKRLLFGLGVGFDRFGGAPGMAISRVMPDSPASRAGLTLGCVILEINGVVTTGRTGEDCVRIIQSAFGPVRMKILDPEQKEKTLKLNKAWLPIPESVLPFAP